MSDFLSVPNPLVLASQEATNRTSTVGSASEQFLRLHLAADTTALLPIEQLTEVLTIPINQIVPIFQMPAWVMGIYNWRGEILWMVDLGHRVGLTPLHHQAMNRSTYTAIVLHPRGSNANQSSAKSQMLGLVVERVEDIEWCNPDLIQSPPSSAVVPELEPFLRGYWIKPNGEMLVVLDGVSLIAKMPNTNFI